MSLSPPIRPRRLRGAFTLVEVMIVVVAMAIIAGAVIPHIGSAIDDAKESAMLADLHMLTQAIERYKMNHIGRPPDVISSNSLPQLVSNTNEQGQIGTGPAFPFGSYILMGIFPSNPLNDDGTVYEADASPPADLTQKTGWWYHKPSGQIWGGEKRKSVFPRA